MPDFKPKVEKMSRHDLLEWVNSTVHGQYKKIEELCSGVAYCQMMELLFPCTIGMKKIKPYAKLEHEFLHNLKLFQSAFTKHNFDKSVPIERLIKGKFQDNFEFLQWFKKFFDTHSAGKENLKMPAALIAAPQNVPKPVRKSGIHLSSSGGSVKSTASKSDILKTPRNGQQLEERTVSPSSLRVLQDTQKQLSEQMLSVELERNTYYKKLAEIEIILNESVKNEVYVEWCKRALAVLYAVDDNIPCGDEDVGEFYPPPEALAESAN